jgi:hypothetical protein
MGGGSHLKLIFFSFSSLRAKKQATRTGQPWQEASNDHSRDSDSRWGAVMTRSKQSKRARWAAAAEDGKMGATVVVGLEVEAALVKVGDVVGKVKVQ